MMRFRACDIKIWRPARRIIQFGAGEITELYGRACIDYSELALTAPPVLRRLFSSGDFLNRTP